MEMEILQDSVSTRGTHLFWGKALSRDYLLHSLTPSLGGVTYLIYILSKNLKKLRPFYLVSKFFFNPPLLSILDHCED